MKGFLNGLSKLLVGVALALALLSLAGVATARYFMARLAVPPPKPLYGSELPAPPPPEPAAEPPEAASPAASPAAAEPAAETPPVAEPVVTNPTPDAALPPGSYAALVSQPIGLVIRSGPGTEHGQLGSVDYNAEVVVLEEPAGQGWIKVRVVASGAEGWVKAGNTRRQE